MLCRTSAREFRRTQGRGEDRLPERTDRLCISAPFPASGRIVQAPSIATGLRADVRLATACAGLPSCRIQRWFQALSSAKCLGASRRSVTARGERPRGGSIGDAAHRSSSFGDIAPDPMVHRRGFVGRRPVSRPCSDGRGVADGGHGDPRDVDDRRLGRDDAARRHRGSLLQGRARAGLSRGGRQPVLVELAPWPAIWRPRGRDRGAGRHPLGDRRVDRYATRVFRRRRHGARRIATALSAVPWPERRPDRPGRRPGRSCELAGRPLRHDAAPAPVRSLAQDDGLGSDRACGRHDPPRHPARRRTVLVARAGRDAAGGGAVRPDRRAPQAAMGRYLRGALGTGPGASGQSKGVGRTALKDG